MALIIHTSGAEDVRKRRKPKVCPFCGKGQLKVVGVIGAKSWECEKCKTIVQKPKR